jgi:hypothetical protein
MGTPVPTIAWHYSKAPELFGVGVTQSTIEGTTLTETISFDKVNEPVDVKCIATNKLGISETTTTINVLGPGSPPSAIQVTSTENRIDVQWKEPHISNGEISVLVLT